MTKCTKMTKFLLNFATWKSRDKIEKKISFWHSKSSYDSH